MLKTLVVLSSLFTCLPVAARAQEAKWLRAPAQEANAVPTAVRENETAVGASPEAQPVDAAALGTAGECTTGRAEQTLHANNVMARLQNNGAMFWKGSGNFYEVPAYGGAHAIFTSGLWIGGMVGSELRFAGTVYGPFEFWPGPLDDAGNPPADCTPYDRIYLVSQNDLQALDAGLPATDDIADWPWDLGAPVEDGDGNPDNYNLAGGDRPQVLGHQTAWWVMNDAAGTKRASLSPSIGLEVQVTAFAVATSDALDNTTFYRYRLVYRGSEPFTDVWFGYFSDPDLGNASNDFVGSDTTLHMGYVYNGTNVDPGEGGYGERPPALGHVFVQGPLVDDRRLGMTTFLYYNGDNTVQGNPNTMSESYGYLRGFWRDGKPMTVGGTGYGGDTPTSFMFSGDPVTRSYWSEINACCAGQANAPSDRKFVMSSGPFSMNPGDIQDIVIALVWSRGEDHLQSVARLREDVAFVHEAFLSGAINDYQVPQQLRTPAAALSPDELVLSVTRGESVTRSVSISNPGTADLMWTASMPGSLVDRFLTVANAQGPLDPPDTGTFSFNWNGFPTQDGEPPHCTQDAVIDWETCNDRPTHQQQVGPARWGINVGGGNGTFRSYLERAITGRGNADRVGGFDFEWRFTGSSLALRALEDGEAVEVPFELWNAGPGTPDDPGDDYRMIPLICEAACGAGSEAMVFDIGGDHPVSGAPNDPASDWIFWHDPVNTSPGEAGYLDWAADLSLEKLGEEVLARQVLVSLNGGTAPPYEQALPEPGTIFRIEMTKRWLHLQDWSISRSGRVPPGGTEEIPLIMNARFIEPGTYRDTLLIETRAPDSPEFRLPVRLEVLERTTSTDTGSEFPATYALDQNYPNPFNPATTIRFGLPAAGPVRLVLYDVLGRQVNVLLDETRPAGWHDLTFDAGGLPAGAYFYRLDARGHRAVKSMLLVK